MNENLGNIRGKKGNKHEIRTYTSHALQFLWCQRIQEIVLCFTLPMSLHLAMFHMHLKYANFNDEVTINVVPDEMMILQSYRYLNFTCTNLNN